MEYHSGSRQCIYYEKVQNNIWLQVFKISKTSTKSFLSLCKLKGIMAILLKQGDRRATKSLVYESLVSDLQPFQLISFAPQKCHINGQ